MAFCLLFIVVAPNMKLASACGVVLCNKSCNFAVVKRLI